MCGGFFFFKQKTAYEMRISDWSSDVCSSDLSRPRAAGAGCGAGARLPDHPGAHPLSQLQLHRHQPPDRHQLRLPRSEDPLLMALAKSTGEDALETAPREVSTFGLALGNSGRSEEHTSELQSLMRISYAVFCLQKKKSIIQEQ